MGWPEAVSCEPGHIDLFALDSTGATVRHKFFSPDAGWGPNGISGDWESIGGPPGYAEGDSVYPVVGISTGRGQLHLFSYGNDGKVYHKFFDPVGGWQPGGQFGDWESIGGPHVAAPNTGGNLAVASGGPGQINVFTLGRNTNDGKVYHKFFGPDGGWGPNGISGDWESIGDSLPPNFDDDVVAAVSWGTGRLDVVAGADSHKFYDSTGGWSGWEGIGGIPAGFSALYSSSHYCPVRSRIVTSGYGQVQSSSGLFPAKAPEKAAFSRRA